MFYTIAIPLAWIAAVTFVAWMVGAIIDLKKSVRDLRDASLRTNDRISEKAGDLVRLRQNLEKAMKL